MRCALAVFLACFALGSLSAQGALSEGSTSLDTASLPPEPSENLQTPSDPWKSFDLLLTKLEAEVSSLKAESARLSASLTTATELSSRLRLELDESLASLSGLKQSLADSEASRLALSASAESLGKQVQALEFERWLWAGAGLLAGATVATVLTLMLH